MREVIKEGRDVNEAIELACAQLGVDRGQASFEIIELPKTSLFGLRKKPAKVRVYVDEPEAPKKKIEKPAPKAAEPIITETPAPQPPIKERPTIVERTQQAPENQQFVNPETPTEVCEETVNDVSTKFTPMDETDGKARTACDYVKSVLLEMGVDAKITAAITDNGIIVRLAGDGLGVVIGRRGETLDALQYLSGLVANRSEGDYLRVTIDTGNYREKRERTLQQLARKLSASALRSGRSSMLEPMNPYERRIIHSTVSTIEGVTSSSIGDEPNRRVVISPVNAKPHPPRRNPAPTDSRPRSNTPRRFNDNKTFRDKPRIEHPAPIASEKPTPIAVDREYAKDLERTAFAKPEPVQNVAEPTTREKPKDEAGDMPLYGKIDL